MSDNEATRVRIDKWLWAARFYKTRSLSAEAVDGGKVHVNGERVKPAKMLKPGDVLVIRNGPYAWEITVLAMSERRGPASEAVNLYKESPESRTARDQTAATIKAENQSNPFPRGRPTKKQRRQIHRFFEENE
ncbi:MAG TPA: RNA-binding S4 domain-containing protein [Burkholderiales bacterium]